MFLKQQISIFKWFFFSYCIQLYDTEDWRMAAENSALESQELIAFENIFK